ncbi:unnamed protein product [Microthlaspi erraticum]|uniref:Uncharacterized protein n=1 Tax=Microthlaspi erraticum TaxID=1685480 RepID=A0A6D2HTE7_9BRAS|nr:unnamed protein product [Microthlaspi erraticum]
MQSPLETQQPERCCRPTTSIVIAEHGLCDKTSKLVCKLTGDIVNKNEEHIWKHVNGRRFFHKLEQVEKELDQAERPRKQEAVRKILIPMKQIFGCLSQVLVQSQSTRVMKKIAKVLIVMPKYPTSSQREQRECQ